MVIDLYTSQSILDMRDFEAIVNPVNCVGVSGAGLARQFAERYPDNDRLYREACRNGLVRPGRGLITETRLTEMPHYIVNFPTKRHWRDSSCLDDIELGLRNLHGELRRRKIRTIAMPRIGAGLGGLPWDTVRQLIAQEFRDETEIEVTVCHRTERMVD